MLLKIYTDQGSLRVIENIEEIEVHPEIHLIDKVPHGSQNSDGTGYNAVTLETANIKQGGMFETPPYYDNMYGETPILNGVKAWPIRFIDYRVTDGYWKRVAIGFRGTTYLCNDQGKTIERILEPGRAAA